MSLFFFFLRVKLPVEFPKGICSWILTSQKWPPGPGLLDLKPGILDPEPWPVICKGDQQYRSALTPALTIVTKDTSPSGQLGGPASSQASSETPFPQRARRVLYLSHLEMDTVPKGSGFYLPGGSRMASHISGVLVGQLDLWAQRGHSLRPQGLSTGQSHF